MEITENNKNLIYSNSNIAKKVNTIKKRRKHQVKERYFEKSFNFKNGEIYSRMNYLLLIANHTKDQSLNLSRIYIKQMKKIKQRNSLKINKNINSKICQKCNTMYNKNCNISVNKIYNKLCYLIECFECKNIQKVNLVNYNLKQC